MAERAASVIRGDKVAVVQSEDCAAHVRHGVAGCLDEASALC
jgi:hypothetical protein